MPENINSRIQTLLGDIFPAGSQHEVVIRVNDAVAYAVWESLNTLAPSERDCICMKYGIVGAPMKFKDVAERVKVASRSDGPGSRERIRQLVAKGLNKMRRPPRSDAILAAMK